MRVLAIDPGNERSAFVILEDGTDVVMKGIEDNHELVKILPINHADAYVIEMIASYGMPVGREVFDTCVWIGRFVQALAEAERPSGLIYRREVKMHLCGNTKAKDSNIRASLLDRFGPGKQKAVGTKKAPGPLYGVKADVWAALALAVTWFDLAGNVHPHGEALRR